MTAPDASATTDAHTDAWKRDTMLEILTALDAVRELLPGVFPELRAAEHELRMAVTSRLSEAQGYGTIRR